ncbi:hypothetical protein SCUCBS95973_001082 [Sporothrix curviconia]|uniref:Xylanolytic transcriptional activator regulatory domain-containing protein n=1 Tax=Sporothrix curviconia TaxID=1260050 RepID=A0ABP0AW50_9PEZI
MSLAGFSGARPGDVALDLPPLAEVLSAVDVFQRNTNSMLPLFHPDKLRLRVRSWFQSPADQRDCTTWAAINVVLALAHRRIPAADTAHPGRNVSCFLNNAQSMMSEITMGKARLLNVQILVGMALLFQGTLDMKPATILVAVALRLAHELGLHVRLRPDAAPTCPQDPATESAERDRVFWCAYILDRDISMRTKQPPIQRLSDIGIDWPAAEPEDGAGLVPCAGVEAAAPTFNFFLARAKLAHIQGAVYDAVFSPRVETTDSYERAEAMSGLRRMLDDWALSIPQQFQPPAMTETSDPDLVRALGILYAAHLACLIWACRAHIMQTAWHDLVHEFGRKIDRDGILAPPPPPPLPEGWDGLVRASREYMQLFAKVEWKDPAFIWMTVCTYVSASLCLTVNTMFSPRQEIAHLDTDLSDACFAFMQDIAQQAPFEPMEKARDELEVLLQYAHTASLHADIHDAISSQDLFEAAGSTALFSSPG